MLPPIGCNEALPIRREAGCSALRLRWRRYMPRGAPVQAGVEREQRCLNSFSVWNAAERAEQYGKNQYADHQSQPPGHTQCDGQAAGKKSGEPNQQCIGQLGSDVLDMIATRGQRGQYGSVGDRRAVVPPYSAGEDGRYR